MGFAELSIDWYPGFPLLAEESIFLAQRLGSLL